MPKFATSCMNILLSVSPSPFPLGRNLFLQKLSWRKPPKSEGLSGYDKERNLDELRRFPEAAGALPGYCRRVLANFLGGWTADHQHPRPFYLCADSGES